MDILVKATIRIILQKKPALRREDEIDRVIVFLKSLEFLSSNHLTYADYRDLANSMKYQEFKKDEYVYRYGQQANHVFVVLKGAAV